MTDWTGFSARHTAGDVIAVTVTKVVPFGCLVEAADGVPGLLREAVDLRVGDQVSARIETIDHDKQRVSFVPA
ncbi:MAG TPA: hypothetical protein VGJ95_22865 [Pseudonocardiaceae bacterium]|jgi:ribosomal protein S1